jgi:hypothetical protein
MLVNFGQSSGPIHDFTLPDIADRLALGKPAGTLRTMSQAAKISRRVRRIGFHVC